MDEYSGLQFAGLDLMSNSNPKDLLDVKITEENCPICWRNNKIRKIKPVYYKMREAIYTCPDRNCTYFITDNFGNLQKYSKINGSLIHSGHITNLTSEFKNPNEHNGLIETSQPQSAPTRSNEIVDSASFLDHIFNDESNNDEVKSIMDEISDLFENNRGDKLEN